MSFLAKAIPPQQHPNAIGGTIHPDAPGRLGSASIFRLRIADCGLRIADSGFTIPVSRGRQFDANGPRPPGLESGKPAASCAIRTSQTAFSEGDHEPLSLARL